MARGQRVPGDGVAMMPGAGLLFTFRCPGCGHDQVYDLDDDEVWDLDPSDYIDAGSWPDEPTLF